MLTRQRLLLSLGAAGLCPLPALAGEAGSRWLERINPDWVVSEAEAIDWHAIKDEKGAALTGNASWRQFLEFLEAKLGAYGCVDIHRSPWTFTRLETSMWPDDSKWGLTSNGQQIPVSNHGANCGLTGPEGVSAPLVLWDDATRPDVAGKIVVYRPAPRANVRAAFSDSDYERSSPFDSYPIEGNPVAQAQGGSHSIAPAVWDEMTASSLFIGEIADLRPAGVVFAMGLNRAATAGLHTFPVPDHYGFPSLYLDRTHGDVLIADARAGRMATIRVAGAHVQSEAYQLIACLPGKDYGSARDQQIHLRTHTDGPSISQDNGAFGLLGIVKYMSNIPQHDRPRTLFVEMDCRHFMPGAERRWEQQDYFAKHPEARDRIVALIATEHLGQIDYVEQGEEIAPSGRSLATWVYASASQEMIDQAYQAAVANNVRSVVIRSPGRPGARGGSQGPWYGMSRQGALRGLPTYGVQGDLGAYWAHSGRLDRFDARSFTRQVAMFAQLTGYMMAADLAALQISPSDSPRSNALSR